MTWSSLESNMFLSVAYDASQRILYLRFHRATPTDTLSFPNDDYQLLLAAESKGRDSLSHIRNHFPFERMAKLRVA